MIYVTVFLLIVCFGSVALADGFKTIDGKEYKNVTVSRVEPDGIVLSSKSGISKVYFTELPKEVQERFHYDAAKAAEFTSDQNEKIKALQLQRAEEAQKRAEERERYWSEHGATSPQSSSLTSVPNQQADHSGGAVRNQPASSTTLSGVRVGPGSVPMLTLQRFESDQFSMVGKVIGVQFNFRDTYTHRIDANWFSGDIRRYDPLTTTHRQFERAKVLVPANALSWFQAIPSDFSGARETVVYVQVEEDRQGGTVLRCSARRSVAT